MNSRLLNTIVLLGLVASIACSTSTIQALEEIKNKEFANDFVGQQIVDTILLQAQAGGPADVVVRLLNGLVLNLKEQQKKHNAEHTALNLGWRAQLKHYRHVVRSLKRSISSLGLRIIRVQKRIRQNKYNIKDNEAQQRIIRQKKADLKAARNIDRQAYLRRHARQVELLKAVNYIVAQLNLAMKSKSFVQLSQIKEQLQKLTKENPLEALVQLTMTFNPSSVNYAINKLGEIRVSLEASIKDDSHMEAVSARQVRALNNQFRAFLRAVAKTLQAARALLARQRSLRRQLRQSLAEARQSLKLHRSLIASVRATRRAYNTEWKAARASRRAQKKTIRQVIGIIQVNVATVNKGSDLSKNLLKKH